MKHVKLFEDKDAKERVALKRKARKAGYDIGDVVYNRIINKNITILSDEDYKYIYKKAKDDWTYNNNTFKNTDKYCTLGAVGENPSVYSLVKKGVFVKKFKPGYHNNEKVDELYDEVINLIRSPKFQKLNQDEYYKLGIKLKHFFNKNIIE